MRKTKYIVKPTTQFKKDYKQTMKRHLDIELLDDIIRALSRGETLTADGFGSAYEKIPPDSTVKSGGIFYSAKFTIISSFP